MIVWNQALLDAIVGDATDPTLASRNMAMVQAAVLDAVNAIDGTPAYYVKLSAPAGASLPAAVSGAAYDVLTYTFPGQQPLFDAVLAGQLSLVADGQAKTDGLAVGKAAGDAIIAMGAGDGWNTYVNYVPGTDPGDWQPTPPMYAEALAPQWANLTPFAMTSPSQFAPPGPPPLSSQAWADAFNEVKSLGSATSTTRTPDETQIAKFWADGAGSYSPPGHWNEIAQQIAVQQGDSLSQDARLFAVLDVTMADAAIVAWNVKYSDNFWRPITAIHAADTDGNDQTAADPNWQPLLLTPSFPEYVSGHSTFSGAAATVLDSFFGSNVSFRTTSLTAPGVTRSFTSFDQAAVEAGRSRIYAGIHYEFSDADGEAAGRQLAAYVLGTFNVSDDVVAPKIHLDDVLPSGASKTNITVTGQVIDLLSGVHTLQVQINNGAFASVAFDSNGRFSLQTSFVLNGSADGPQVLNFRATDYAGNTSVLVPFTFTLDTLAPVINLTSPTAGSTIDVSTLLTGSADGTGSAITSLTYRFDNAAAMPFTIGSDGSFDESLDISRLSFGNHTLQISASDAAGNVADTSLTVSLTQMAPFQVSEVTPADGTADVGSTFRPQVHFTRPVDVSSLSANNVYATDAGGNTLPASIVPATDGSFLWMFFANPLPSASTITLHVDGSTILRRRRQCPARRRHGRHGRRRLHVAIHHGQPDADRQHVDHGQARQPGAGPQADDVRRHPRRRRRHPAHRRRCLPAPDHQRQGLHPRPGR